MKKSVLDQVTVSFRCPMDWEKMAGDESERFCNKCQKSVTNLSQMTSEEAESFIQEEGPLGQACVRFFRDGEGKLVTKGCGAPGGGREEGCPDDGGGSGCGRKFGNGCLFFREGSLGGDGWDSLSPLR